VLPVASLVLAVVFVGAGPVRSGAALGALLGLTAANLYFFPGIYYQFRSDIQSMSERETRQRFLQDAVGERALIDRINRELPHARVLMDPDRAQGATLAGKPLYVNWYATAQNIRFEAVKSEADVAALLKEWAVDFVILNTADTSTSSKPRWHLREHLSRNAAPIARSGTMVLYGTGVATSAYVKAFDLQTALAAGAKEPVLLIQPTGGAVGATPTPLALSVVPLQGSQAVRYSAKFTCADKAGYWIAQLNFDRSDPYYRLVPCAPGETQFSESVPVPLGARSAVLYATSRDTPTVTATQITVEVR
jgi:hypothetical protein